MGDRHPVAAVLAMPANPHRVPPLQTIKKLGSGAQGGTFLVKDRRDEEQYVLKKVECNDEGEAKKAFEEAIALDSLEHNVVQPRRNPRAAAAACYTAVLCRRRSSPTDGTPSGGYHSTASNTR